MTKTPSSLQDLRRRIYRKAKSEPSHRFWGLFVHIAKLETLEEAYGNAKRNGGAAGIDRQNFEDIETQGRTAFLVAIREDLVTGRYKPKPNRRVDIPKENGKVRTLQIPCIRDRVVPRESVILNVSLFGPTRCGPDFVQ
jgi:retron-type reverse transcriptase